MTYQANSSNCLGKGKKHVYRRIEPFCPSFIGTPGLIRPLELLLKKSNNGGRRIAGLQLRGEWMSTQIVLRPSFVRIQGIIEQDWKLDEDEDEDEDDDDAAVG
jgi:hypothetical protein